MSAPGMSCANGTCNCPRLLDEILSGQKALEERLTQRMDDGMKDLKLTLQALLQQMSPDGHPRRPDMPAQSRASSASAGTTVQTECARPPTEAHPATASRSGAPSRAAPSRGSGEAGVASSSSATSFGSHLPPGNSPAPGSRRSQE
jgi:hypothetical protein